MSTRLGFLNIKLPKTGYYQKSVNISMSPVPPRAHIKSAKFTIPVSIAIRSRKARTCLPIISKLSLVIYSELVPTFSVIELPPTQPPNNLGHLGKAMCSWRKINEQPKAEIEH